MSSAFAWTRVSDAVPNLAAASVIALVTGLLGGWTIARLAPQAPFKHAFALGLAMLLTAVTFTIWSRMPGRALVTLVCLPAVLVGARLSTRLRSRSA